MNPSLSKTSIANSKTFPLSERQAKIHANFLSALMSRLREI